MRSFLAALRFLTILPVPGAPTDKASLLPGFPAVGLLIGCLLFLVASLLSTFVSVPVASVLVLVVWVSVTGALHIDAVGDSFDALLGGVGSRERSLRIMKDPLLGAAGAAAIVLLLLLKFVLLQAALSNVSYMCFLAPVLARSMAVLLFSATRYVSEQGLAAAWHTQSAVQIARLSLATIFILICYTSSIAAALIAFAVLAAVYFFWRRLWQRRIGGFTGDTAGAMIELQEVAALIVLLQVS